MPRSSSDINLQETSRGSSEEKTPDSATSPGSPFSFWSSGYDPTEFLYSVLQGIRIAATAEERRATTVTHQIYEGAHNKSAVLLGQGGGPPSLAAPGAGHRSGPESRRSRLSNFMTGIWSTEEAEAEGGGDKDAIVAQASIDTDVSLQLTADAS